MEWPGSAKAGQSDVSELATGCTELHLRREGIQVSGLEIDRSRPFKPAGKTLSRAETRNDTARSNTDHFIVAIPGHKMSVIDDVYFFLNELSEMH